MITHLENNRQRHGAKAVFLLTVLVALLNLAALTIDAGPMDSAQSDQHDFLSAAQLAGLQSEPAVAARAFALNRPKIDSKFGDFSSDSDVRLGARRHEVSKSP